jgi:putative oxidoreductase
VSDLWYPMIRITVGTILLVHGWGKIKTGITGLAGYLDKVGLAPPVPLAYVVFINETIGAVCIVLGLFTRLFAASIAIELALHFGLFTMPRDLARPLAVTNTC